MNFISLSFIIAFPIVLLAYWLVPERYRWAMLLLASCLFYFWWNAWQILLMAGVIIATYFAARMMEKGPFRLFWMLFSVFSCLGLLFVFKYLNFTLQQVYPLLYPESEFRPLDLILPVGISFYTFQALTYVLDVYQGKAAPEHHFGHYALFISFFPQLVAGPIERAENLLPQLKASKRPEHVDMIEGFNRILLGFFKKLAIADFVAPVVDSIYTSPETATAPAVILGTVLFALQIYCDFSGYSDIAVGCARMLGIRLMENFDEPYSAVTIQDFWRRWHISLTRCFTEYLYLPLGGNRKGKLRQMLNTLIVFLFSGLWHGADWTFVVWGGLHGLFLVVDLLLRKKKAVDMQSKAERILGRVLTFALVCFAWIFFRAESMHDAGAMVTALFSRWDGLWENAGFLAGQWSAVLVQLPVHLVLVHFIRKGTAANSRRSQLLRWMCLVMAIAAVWIGNLSVNPESTFIYFRF